MPVVKWSEPSRVNMLDAVSVVAGGNALSDAYDNSLAANRHRYCDIEIKLTYDTAPVANYGCPLFLLYADKDGSYEYGSGSVDPVKMPEGACLNVATTDPVVYIFEAKLLSPRPLKLCFLNENNQTCTITADILFYNENIVS